MSHSGSTSSIYDWKRFAAAQGIAFVIALGLVLLAEIERLTSAPSDMTGLQRWLVDINVDTTLFLPWLVSAVGFWWIRRPILTRLPRWMIGLTIWLRQRAPDGTEPRGRVWPAVLLIGATSLTVSIGTSRMKLPGDEQFGQPPIRFGELPPAYHDEFSYLFQAKTFLAGRLWFPSHPTAAPLFDQMHVLNEGRFTSRYFPAVGAWTAPFLAMGHPYWGQWLAGALTAVFVFGAGRQLGGNGVGLSAGMLTALSPGMALFSNLLLSHHAALLGLSLFLFSFFRMQRTKCPLDAVLAGIGLSFAMLARPLTAAGFGLPFGIWLFYWLLRGGPEPMTDTPRRRVTLTLAVGAPVLIGFVLLFGHNRAVTGSGWTTGYQQYTDIYTPRHVYGFNNVVRGEQRLGPKVLENYDRWAENLTPALALKNVRRRLMASWQWTLGIVPLAMAGTVFLFYAAVLTTGWRLIAAAIVSLHVVYVPYWFVGIMEWHYVFETGPLWLLIFAAATRELLTGWRTAGRPWMCVWWIGVLVPALLTTYTEAPPLWSTSRLRAAVESTAFSRRRYALFQNLVDDGVLHRPALVLIEPDPDDRHIDFVTNDPSLDADVLIGRYRPDVIPLQEVLRLFPDRTCYLFHAKTFQLLRVEPRRRSR